MRNAARIGFAAVALFCALIGTTPALAQARCMPTPIARVVKAVGIVSIPGPQLIQIAAGSELDVCAGETVATGPRSQAAIQLFASNQTITVNQNTTIRIVAEMPQAPRSVIELLQGIIRLFNPIGRQLDVRTPYATAGTEGTEFFVGYDPQTEETRAGVIEGLVRVTRNGDTLLLEAGQAAIAPRIGPLQRLDIVPADAVRWSIFYPPAAWTLPPAEEMALDARVARAWQAWRNGDQQAFATELNSLPQILPPPAPPPIADARSLLRFAALLLIVGQVEEAEAAIAQAELLYGRAALTPLVRPIAAIVGLGNCRSLGPGWALILGLRSVIAVARNRTDEALAQSECAVTAAREVADPSLIAAAAIARSYALQSAFRLPEARALLAMVTPADDPLVLARLAELDLSLGNNRAARLEAQRANQLAPSLSLTSSILGFAALANYDFAAARTAFARAAMQSPGDPLPHLGLGLVAIRSGRLFSFGSANLEEGRRELVIAVALHPEYAVARELSRPDVFGASPV